MNRKELAEAVARETFIPRKEVLLVIDCMTRNIARSLRNGEPVKLSGFGTFDTRLRKARSGVNPRTGAEMLVTSAVIPVFRVSGALRKQINERDN